MKVRIKGNSVRFRLTKSDLGTFRREGIVQESTRFDDESCFTYVLQRSTEPALKATLKDDMLRLSIPEKLADDWTQTDRVGIESNEGRLHLLVEKDFQCLENVAEDQSDNYPNPLAEKRS